VDQFSGGRPEAFADLPDPRRERNRLHRLSDILTISRCATVCGCQTWEQIAAYGRAKESWFRTFLALPNGVPSHDTFYRVFSLLAPEEFSLCFGRWMASACEATGLKAIAIDGKSVRRAKRPTATGGLHLVSAWAGANHLTLGQVSVSDGSNEIALIPELLRVLDLKGAIVTIDAAGTRTANAAIIRQREGHHLLAVKGNQEGLEAAIEEVFRRAGEADFVGFDSDTHATSERGHGRVEERCVPVIRDPQGIPEVWPDVASVVLVGRERQEKGRDVSTAHYYLSSHRGSAEEFAELVRGHWQIENRQPADGRSDNWCVRVGTDYHGSGGPAGVGRVVRPASRPRRRPRSDRDTVPLPPRARDRPHRRRSGIHSRPNGGDCYSGFSPNSSPDRSGPKRPSRGRSVRNAPPRRLSPAPKVQPWHLDRNALADVRPSTPQPVLDHRGSTARPYAPADRAVALGGIRSEVIITIDDDLGRRGQSIEGRPGFQRRLAEVARNRVGLILGPERSRRARSCQDGHPPGSRAPASACCWPTPTACTTRRSTRTA
jgi:predicted transposase YbfD/YdcC